METPGIACKRVPRAFRPRLIQGDDDSRVAETRGELSGDDSCVVYHHDVAWTKQVRQVAHDAVFDPGEVSSIAGKLV